MSPDARLQASMSGYGTLHLVRDLCTSGVLHVEDGNHGEYRPLQHEFTASGTPFVRPDDLVGGRVRLSGCDHINSNARARVRKGVGRAGDILLTHRATVGRLAIADNDAPEFVTNPGVTVWRSLDRQVLDQRYLYYFLSSPPFMERLHREAGNTDIFPYVSLTQQRGLHVALPPIGRQRAIASMLGTLDDKIELNRKTNETLEAMARALFKSWFVDFDPVRAKAKGRQPSGMDAETANLFPSEFVESELGMIPKGWRAGRLEEMVEFLAGFPFKSEQFERRAVGPRLVKGSNVAPGRLDWSDAIYWPHEPEPRMQTCWLVEGDVILAMDRPWIPAGLKIAMVGSSDLPSLLVQRVARLRGTAGFPGSMIYLTLNSEQFTAHLLNVQTGTTVPHISKDNILSFCVVVAPRGIAEAFDRIARPLWSRFLNNCTESLRLSAIRDSLLPKLMSGELPIDRATQVAEFS